MVLTLGRRLVSLAQSDGQRTDDVHHHPRITHADLGALGAPVLSMLRDGTDLTAVWSEFSELLDYWNKERTKLTDLLALRTTLAGEAVPQNVTPALFEKSTELGSPRAVGTPGDSLMLGYMFDDFDLDARFSRLFLRGADVRQVRAIMDNILTGDVMLTTGEILKAIFTPTVRKPRWGQRLSALQRHPASTTALPWPSIPQ